MPLMLPWTVIFFAVSFWLFGLRVAVCAENVKIGVIMPFSGMRADSGRYALNGLELAKEDFAREEHLKYRPDFILEDSHYDPAAAVTAEKLIGLAARMSR